MALADPAVRHARATGKECALADFDGLSLSHDEARIERRHQATNGRSFC
jgi:hypothetical protein